MTVSPSIKIMIAENRDAYSIQMQAESEGMLTIIEDGVFKAVQGLTSIEEVLNVTL
jgi:type II secretory ATPase GspE/PulE/Tfp pilus assembly ATPase PilB-like protein